MTPAVLALIDGNPVLRPSADNLQKVINTRALILFDPSKNMYYMALMDGWVEAPTMNGPWNPAKHAPTKQMDKIRQAAVTNNQNQALGNPQQSLEDAYKDGRRRAFTSAPRRRNCGYRGRASMLGRYRAPVCRTSPIPAATSSSTPPVRPYYVLTAGRWFSTSLVAEWSVDLRSRHEPSADFAKIPVVQSKADVLVPCPARRKRRKL